jgi:dihydrofolate reductase
MAKALTDIPKYVFSSELSATTWGRSTIVKTIDTDVINQFKKEGQKGLLTIGSPGLVAALTERELVDDYYFCIQPLLAGSGSVRLFDKFSLEARHPLKMAGSHQLKSGVMIINYQKA